MKVVSTKLHYFKIVPPVSPYTIIPPGGIIIYELTGVNILKQRNVVDPIYRVGEIREKTTDMPATGRFFSRYSIY